MTTTAMVPGMPDPGPPGTATWLAHHVVAVWIPQVADQARQELADHKPYDHRALREACDGLAFHLERHPHGGQRVRDGFRLVAERQGPEGMAAQTAAAWITGHYCAATAATAKDRNRYASMLAQMWANIAAGNVHGSGIGEDAWSLAYTLSRAVVNCWEAGA